MNPFEYAVGLISIVIGLAIGDMGVSLHKLLRHRSTVGWDARAVLSAGFVFLVVTGMWFQFWSIRGRLDIFDYFLFLTIVVELLIAFLMAAAALPDEPEAGLDLATFYESNARSLWFLVALFNVSYLAHWIYFVATSPEPPTFAWVAKNAVTGTIPIIFATVLALRPRSRRLHLVTIVFLIANQLFDLSGASLR